MEFKNIDTIMPTGRLGIFESILLRLFQVLHNRRIKQVAKKTHGTRPSYCKVYDDCPMLEHRVFLPSKLKGDTNNSKLPLLIDIYGGGYFLGAPSVDDPYCQWMADNCSMIVVAIDYRKAPKVKFPTAHEDCIAAVTGVINDPDLSIDHENIFIGGMSAGGNLALSTSRSKEHKGRFKGMILWYPVTDWATSVKTRSDFRKEPKYDKFTTRAWGWIHGLYIPPGVDLANPALSPQYADRDDFPQRSFFICGSKDLLTYDTAKMTDKLIGDAVRISSKTALVDSWRAGNVVSAEAKGQGHAFNELPFRKENAEAMRQKMLNELYGMIKQWLDEQIAAPIVSSL